MPDHHFEPVKFKKMGLKLSAEAWRSLGHDNIKGKEKRVKVIHSLKSKSGYYSSKVQAPIAVSAAVAVNPFFEVLVAQGVQAKEAMLTAINAPLPSTTATAGA